MGALHRNSHDNEEEHHLYCIWDKEDKELIKYGISCEPIGKDNLSDRIRKQLKLYNAVVGRERFYAEIILTGIKGRKNAEKIENEYIEAFVKKYGRKPRANLK